MSFFQTTLVIFARVIYMFFAVISFVAFPEATKLLEKIWTRDGDTLYVSLVICEAATTDVSGSEVTYDVSKIEGCFALDFLVNACAASLLLSAIAMVIFLVRDSVHRYNNKEIRGRFSEYLGMGTFLSIIIIQAALCTGALVKEANFWVERFGNELDELDAADGDGALFKYGDIKTYGNRTILMVAAGTGFVTAFIVFVEHLLGFCYREAGKEENFNDGDGRKSLQKLNESLTTNPTTSQTTTLNDTVSPQGAKTLNEQPTWTNLSPV